VESAYKKINSGLRERLERNITDDNDYDQHLEERLRLEREKEVRIQESIR
jgi:hypothetical protein